MEVTQMNLKIGPPEEDDTLHIYLEADERRSDNSVDVVRLCVRKNREAELTLALIRGDGLVYGFRESENKILQKAGLTESGK